ncbi:MFS transporter [Pararobbsia alpina]|uniref:4-hydroxybenzoate transporter PcaK n=1 Tax=Pararobbsia alpina TaxID=621374 RepID=A0A6S7BDZ3_9BURK|nr:aromatic acid/H+ symport family MFS transporter [Pararobbsia alpina]CAB3796249.1 4-hydroxybenzoate transporter PcaK [Pararobbsia alpina]
MEFAEKINIQEFLDTRPFGSFHWKILLLCLFILILDGFDVVAMGFVAPALIADWKLSRAALAPVFSMGLFGLAVGALLGGPLADRFGRRKVIISAVVVFGLVSLASVWSPNVAVLSLMRFLTGLGLGASQPNAATLASEYAPRRYRALMVTVIYCGFTLGAAGAGFIATAIIPVYGWPSVLFVGGVAPLVLALVLFVALPESAKFLAVRRAGRRQLERIINQISPRTVGESTQFLSVEKQVASKGAVRAIMGRPHTAVTVALWVGLFMNMMTVYFLNSWMPLIVKDNNFTMADAALISAMLQVGGTLGNIIIGWEMDRFGSHKVVSLTLIGAAIFTVALSQFSAGFSLVMVLAFLLGYCINSTNASWTAMAATYYPTEMRATGTSWMTGVGRFGAILGASLGGVLLGSNWNFSQLFLALTVPIAICIVATGLKARHERPVSRMVLDAGVDAR